MPARFFTAAALEAETPRLKNPSEAVFREVGCHGVAEGAALAAAGADGTLVVAKRKSARVTCAIAEAPDIIDPARSAARAENSAVVGIGPARAEWLTPEARRLLETSDAAVGYSLYLDLVAPLIAHAERFDSDARLGGSARAAGAGAGGGGPQRSRWSPPAMPASTPWRHWCSNVWTTGGRLARTTRDASRSSSRRASRRMQAAAARAGAPLGHDFCAISLSDLLTPWETIEARIRAAAEGDFVIAFYNPVSERRRTQLAAAKTILLAPSPARHAGRARPESRPRRRER